MGSVRPICKSIPISDDDRVAYSVNIDSRSIKGIFSFTYYVPLKAETAKSYIYADGIMLYLDMIRHNPSKWAGWKVVLYMDEYTYEKMLLKAGDIPKEEGARRKAQEEEYARRRAQFKNVLETDPNIILAVIRWGQYKKTNSGSSVEPIMMRCFRMKACEDFPDVPVLIRDADTIFENFYNDGRFKDFDYNNLHRWESEYYNGLLSKKRRYKFFAATTVGYHRYWHQKPTKKTTDPFMIGSFAGVCASLGRIQEWKSGDLWNDCISYMTGRCKIKISRNEAAQTIYNTVIDINRDLALDEPILVYIIIPQLFRMTFFFMFEFGGDIKDTNINSIIKSYSITKADNVKKMKNTLGMFAAAPSVSLSLSGKYGHEALRAAGTGYHTPLTLEGMRERAIPALGRLIPSGYFNTLRKRVNSKTYENIYKEVMKEALARISPEYLEIERRARFDNPLGYRRGTKRRRNRGASGNGNEENESPSKRDVNNGHASRNNAALIRASPFNYIDRYRYYHGKDPTNQDYVREVFTKPVYHIFLYKFFETIYSILNIEFVCKLPDNNKKEGYDANSNSNSNNNGQGPNGRRTRRKRGDSNLNNNE